MSPTVNWEDDYSKKNDGYEPLPEGRYGGEIIECSTTFSKAGNEMWQVTIGIQTPRAWRIFDRVVWSKKASQRYCEFLLACGFAAKGQYNYEPKHVLGKNISFFLAIEEYNGKKQNVIPFDGYRIEFDDVSEAPPDNVTVGLGNDKDDDPPPF